MLLIVPSCFYALFIVCSVTDECISMCMECSHCVVDWLTVSKHFISHGCINYIRFLVILSSIFKYFTVFFSSWPAPHLQIIYTLLELFFYISYGDSSRYPDAFQLGCLGDQCVISVKMLLSVGFCTKCKFTFTVSSSLAL